MLSIEYKIRLHQHCNLLLNNIIHEIDISIKSQKEGMNSNSSAGDKHNTEQAMQHLEEEKKQQQLFVAIQNKKVFSQINPNQICQKIQLGALVNSNQGLFYFSVPLGKINFENQEIMLISLASPICKILMPLKIKESVSFNDMLWTLEGIN